MLPKVNKYSTSANDIYTKNGQVCVKYKSVPGRRMHEECNRLKKQLIQRINQYSSADLTTIQRAYEIALQQHGDVLRQSRDCLYTVHPLSVALSLADLQASSDIIIAALLHDTVEDTAFPKEVIAREFNNSVFEIVDAVTEVTKEEVNLKTISPEATHARLDELTGDKLLSSDMWYEALLVRLADREHNLDTIEGTSAERARKKAQDTQNFLLPIAKQLGIRYYNTVLEDYCLNILDPDTYNDIKVRRNELLQKNGRIMGEVIKTILNPAFKKNNFYIPPHKPFLRQDYRTLFPSEILGQLSGHENLRYYSKQDVYLKEVILTFNPLEMENPFSSFFDLFSKILYKNGIMIQYPDFIFDGLCYHVILIDTYENKYSVQLVPSDKIEAFYLGTPLIAAKARDVAKQRERQKKLQVYSYDTLKKRLRSFTVSPNSTALDLAFEVHPTLALCSTACYIRKDNNFTSKDQAYRLSTILNAGDVVTFIADYNSTEPEKSIYHAELDWFHFLTTAQAKDMLINYFKSKATASTTQISAK